MRKRSIPFVDRLNERGLVDRWGFLAFAFIGSAAILLAKVLSASAIGVAAGAAFAMLLYAWIVDWSGTGRIRSDQAGDNCYYLGLIFTLVSLAYAIFTFDPAHTATTIVQGFGIALATTIMGLILRVFFNQARVDLIETEDSIRLELAEAAGHLKTELSQIIVRMNDFSHETVQSLSELRSAVAEQISAATADAQKVSTAAAEAIATQVTATTSRMRELAAAAEKVAGNLDGHGEGLRSIEAASREMAAGVGAIGEAASANQAALAGLTSQIEQLATLHETLQASGHGLGEAVAGLHASVSTFTTSAAALDSNLADRLAQFRQAPIEGMTEAAGSIAAAVARIGAELDGLVNLQRRTAEQIAGQSAAALEIASRHNQALETELSRSRGKVEQIHEALVEMTEELVRQVEAPPAT